MRCKEFCRIALGMLLAGFIASPLWDAARADGALAIGSSLGVSRIEGDGDGFTVIGVPNSVGLVATTPGFRVAHVSPGRGFELGLDLGLFYLNSSGTSVHDVLIGLDGAGFLSPGNDTSPYIGGEVGIHNVDLFGNGSQTYLGVAVGIRHVIASDHGAAKVGIGYRRFFESQSDGFPGLDVIELKVAFDVWIPS